MSTPKHLRAITLLPVTVTLVIPAALLFWTRGQSGLWSLPLPDHLGPALFGGPLICIGLVALVVTIRVFAIRGRGTLAPWDPTQRLVVHSLYRYVRNPMISGVFCILLGEAVLFASTAILLWTVLFLAVNLVYMRLVEERSLDERFGEEYATYRENVPAWIPRLRPWDPRLFGHESGQPSVEGENDCLD